MRGRAFAGVLNEGDRVRAHGRMRSGTFRADRVESLTTGAEVRAGGTPGAVLVPACLFIAPVVAFLAWGAYGLFTMPSGPGWDRP
ncbi:hypothetical protein [Streptomyces toxytricini]|uniref:hypothetical protein n=1 Tax=Streptomyces toxytricini TaxID=67369 RepID=UPI0034149CD8